MEALHSNIEAQFLGLHFYTMSDLLVTCACMAMHLRFVFYLKLETLLTHAFFFAVLCFLYIVIMT